MSEDVGGCLLGFALRRSNCSGDSRLTSPGALYAEGSELLAPVAESTAPTIAFAIS